MTPEQKAKELVGDFRSEILSANAKHNQVVEHPIDLKFTMIAAKQCALICCDEVLKTLSEANEFYEQDEQIEYWQSVKSEINKL